MKILSEKKITSAVKDALIEINYKLDDTFISRLENAKDNESNALSKSILEDILENQEIAKQGVNPLCQDTGVAVIFADVGIELKIDGTLEKAINEGVKLAYDEGYLRKSMVRHPFDRANTKDNTPAVIHTNLVKGNKLTLHLAAKGAGSENMSKVFMLKPSDGIEGVKKVVKDTIFNSGGKPCPPIIVGIGIGGNFEKSTLLAKQALFRDLNDSSDDPIIKELEDNLYTEINALGVGPMGVGGDTTCVGVKINTFPMHIASLPVAINIQCHANRHKKVVL